jgi:hypothetical protein
LRSPTRQRGIGQTLANASGSASKRALGRGLLTPGPWPDRKSLRPGDLRSAWQRGRRAAPSAEAEGVSLNQQVVANLALRLQGG